MTDLERKIWDLLYMNHCGAENAITAAKIQQMIHPRPGYRMITKSCERLLEEKLYPVISNDKGFFVAVDKSEIDDYYRRLELRNQGIYRRMAALKKVRPFAKPVQGLFEFAAKRG